MRQMRLFLSCTALAVLFPRTAGTDKADTTHDADMNAQEDIAESRHFETMRALRNAQSGAHGAMEAAQRAKEFFSEDAESLKDGGSMLAKYLVETPLSAEPDAESDAARAANDARSQLEAMRVRLSGTPTGKTPSATSLMEEAHQSRAVQNKEQTKMYHLDMRSIKSRAEKEKLDSELKKVAAKAGPTKCYSAPCKWVKGNPSEHSSGYYTYDQSYGYEVKGSGPAPAPACPYNMAREWTSCNDGTMPMDGCKGYCAWDSIPGYVNWLQPPVSGAGGNAHPLSVRLVTKGEIDLMREQLDRKWSDMFQSLTSNMRRTEESIQRVQTESTEGYSASNQMERRVQEVKGAAEMQDKTLEERIERMDHQLTTAFVEQQVQNQRLTVAALHGVSGLCCCDYARGDGSEGLKCEWYTFKGDIDFRGSRGSALAGPSANQGALTEMGAAGEATLRCGNDGETLMYAYPMIFASKLKMKQEGKGDWQDDVNGPFFGQAYMALDRCAQSRGWQNYIAVSGQSGGRQGVSRKEQNDFVPYSEEPNLKLDSTMTIQKVDKSALTGASAQEWFNPSKSSAYKPPGEESLIGRSSEGGRIGGAAAEQSLTERESEGSTIFPKNGVEHQQTASEHHQSAPSDDATSQMLFPPIKDAVANEPVEKLQKIKVVEDTGVEIPSTSNPDWGQATQRFLSQVPPLEPLPPSPLKASSWVELSTPAHHEPVTQP